MSRYGNFIIENESGGIAIEARKYEIEGKWVKEWDKVWELKSNKGIISSKFKIITRKEQC